MVGRPRQDRSNIRAVVIAVRFPQSIVELLDALVVHEKNQIAEKGLAGTSNRTAVLESLIKTKAKQVGLLSVDEGGPTKESTVSTVSDEKRKGMSPVAKWIHDDPLGDGSERQKPKKKRSGPTQKRTGKKKSVWSRLRKPEV